MMGITTKRQLVFVTHPLNERLSLATSRVVQRCAASTQPGSACRYGIARLTPGRSPLPLMDVRPGRDSRLRSLSSCSSFFVLPLRVPLSSPCYLKHRRRQQATWSSRWLLRFKLWSTSTTTLRDLTANDIDEKCK